MLGTPRICTHAEPVRQKGHVAHACRVLHCPTVEDQRVQSALLGGGLGLVLVVALLAVRPAGYVTASPFDTGLPLPLPSAVRSMSNAELYAAFEELGTATSFGTPMTLAVSRAGDLVLPGGPVVASDAYFVGLESEAFTTALPPGRHPVLLLEARMGSGGGSVAAAMIRAAPGDPVSWEIAHLPGQDPATLGPDDVFVYGVDSGTGAFASIEAAAAIARLSEADLEAHSNAISDGLSPAEDVYLNSTSVVVDPVTGANLIAIVSGYGDGGYPSFFGLDRAGRPIVLMTDFGILDSADQD
jgi:hypothetical protein